MPEAGRSCSGGGGSDGAGGVASGIAAFLIPSPSFPRSSQLEQVILNLIINAFEAMSDIDEGARELLISTGNAEADGVFVAVRDSGPGLASATVERLFESFYTTKPGGLGLGLSICRSIIEGHGGRLWADTNEPRGAVFQCTIPAHPDTVGVASHPHSAAGAVSLLAPR